MKLYRLLPPALACFTACVALAQQAAGPAPAAALPDEEDAPEIEEEWDFGKGRGPDPLVMEQLNRMVPAGSKAHEGLRYPVYGRRSPGSAPVRQALFESRKVTRMDETHILFEGAVYTSYDDPRRPNVATRTVMLKDAIYDLQNHLIFSNSPVTVEDRQFGIHCDSILHDLKTGLTDYSGRVTLYIDVEQEEDEPASGTTPSPAPNEPAAPAKTAPPK
jgi:hypothetical protein